MKNLFLSKKAQLEIVTQHIRYFEDFEKYHPRDTWARGGYEASQRFMCLIFGKAKFKYMDAEIDRQWKNIGEQNWNYEKILSANAPTIVVKI